MEIDFNTKPTYGGDDKYKIYIYINSYNKKGSKKVPE